MSEDTKIEILKETLDEQIVSTYRHNVPSELKNAIGKGRWEGIIRRVNATPVEIISASHGFLHYISGQWYVDRDGRIFVADSCMNEIDEGISSGLAKLIGELTNVLRVHKIIDISLWWEDHLLVRVPVGCGVVSDVPIGFRSYLSSMIDYSSNLLDRAFQNHIESEEELDAMHAEFRVTRNRMYNEFNAKTIKTKEDAQ